MRARLHRVLTIVILIIVPIPNAGASDFKLGAGLGYGGCGVSKPVIDPATGAATTVSKAESPGIISLSLDYLVDDYWMVSFDQTRGFRLAPFSSGAGFLGFTGRWFFRDPLPSVSKKSQESILLMKRFSPFLGFSLGVGTADITRENDQIPEVKDSGVYWGYRLGVEYPVAPGSGYRIELGSLSGGSLNGFMLQFELYFFL